MNYIAYKLTFNTGVHIGNGKLSDAEFSMYADTLFSALCQEALLMGGEAELNKLVDYAKNDELIISDGFPYIGDTLYIPKPMCKVVRKETDNNSILKKKYKKLSYIPIDKLDEFLAGEFDVVKESDKFSEQLGVSQLFEKSAIREFGDSELYSVGAYRFCENSGIYIIFGVANDDILYYIEDLMLSMESSGIGGKRNSGFGNFTINKLDVSIKDKLDGVFNEYITLSSSMAQRDDLEKAIDGASYSLSKRSGYVSSNTYTDDGDFVKKKDFYVFKSGSVFKNKFSGDIFDVSDNGNHPVYRYAKPMFLGVNL